MVNIQDIRIGDVIREQRGGFDVTHLDFLSCSSGGVYVNGKYCYEWNEQVLRKARVSDECPRCGGDHSWCQSVQPGEFGPEEGMAVLHGAADMPEPAADSPFSDKALRDKLRRQAREKAYA